MRLTHSYIQDYLSDNQKAEKYEQLLLRDQSGIQALNIAIPYHQFIDKLDAKYNNKS